MAPQSDAATAVQALRAGWPVQEIPTLIGVAHCESGNDPSRDQKGAGGRGLMQIDIDQHKQFANDPNLHDPVHNLELALGIWKAQGWSRGWSCYSSGKYRSHVPSVTDVLSWLANPGNLTVPAGMEVKSEVSSADPTQGIKAVGDAISSGAQRVLVYAQVGAGLAVMIAAGIVLVVVAAAENPDVRSAVKTAAKVAVKVVP